MFSAKETLIVDFNDSFTYNIYELLRKAGTRNFEIIPADSLYQYLAAVDFKLPGRIILSPGPGVPSEYPAAERLLARSFAAQVPVLGICLGHQILYTHFGGALRNLETVVHGQPRTICLLADDPLFKGIPERFRAGLYHSWAADYPLPPAVELLGESEEGMIMAVRHREYNAWGIQFHPESFISEYGVQLLTNFLSL